jgi:hypothetical protein
MKDTRYPNVLFQQNEGLSARFRFSSKPANFKGKDGNDVYLIVIIASYKTSSQNFEVLGVKQTSYQEMNKDILNR